ncbi:hypothetical protein MaudCBS49596_006715 [Microsporum audouinii]
MALNVFGYALEDGGAWEIRADNLKDSSVRKDTFAKMHKEFRAVAKDKNVAWLQAHRATHKAQLHAEQITTGYATGDA